MGHWWIIITAFQSQQSRLFVRRVKRAIWSMFVLAVARQRCNQNYGRLAWMGWLVAMALMWSIMAKSSCISWFLRKMQQRLWIGWQNAILPFIWRAIMVSLLVLIFGSGRVRHLRLTLFKRGNLQSLLRVRNQKISFMASSMVGNSTVTT